MADELKSFEQTHWLRELLAAQTWCALEVYIEDDYPHAWAKLSNQEKDRYRTIASRIALAFKAAVEAAQQEA